MSKKNIIIGIAGPTNSGKSSLLNNIIGEKLSSVTHKAQTTRSGLRGLKVIEDTQMVFIDTPGIFDAKTKFEKSMLENAFNILDDVDLIFLLIDCNKSLEKLDKKFLEKIKYLKAKTFLVLNKIDLIHRSELLEKVKKYNDFIKFKETFLISAINGDGVESLINLANKEASIGPWLYPEDQIADLPLRNLAAETTREKLTLRLHQELPYQLTVETEAWEERKDGSCKIDQLIYVMRDGHKGIVLGNKGETMKAVSIQARAELEEFLGRRVHLFLQVKVRPNWLEEKERYSEMGLDFRDGNI